MGKLITVDNECINVSLPSRDIRKLERDGPRRVEIYGVVFPSPKGEPEVAQLTTDGRRIGFWGCGDFYVFVREPGGVQWLR